MKKVLSFFILMLLPMVAGAEAVEIDGIYYNLISKGGIKGAEVTSKPNTYTDNVVIPASVTYDGVEYSVTTIGAWAFSGCSGLASVTIPISVKRIGDSAFRNCSGLTSVHISDIAAWCKISFVGRDSNPLYYAHHLYLGEEEINDLVIPHSVTRIGDSAFYGCSNLNSVTIPNSVTSIGGSAFSGCSGLTSVAIPNSVTSIGGSAFYGCSGLTSVTIPHSVTSIGGSAFYGCSGLTSVHISNIAAWFKISFSNLYSNPLSNAHHLYLADEEIKDLVIPSSVTSIGESAFYGCSGLNSVTIPNSVTSIGDYAFSDCSGLTSVTIPNSVTSIGGFAFYGCSGLTSVTISNSVTSIGISTFQKCSGLTSITIPHSVMSIGNDALSNCSGLTSVTIGNSVTSIGERAFYGCSGLTSVTIPNSLTSIGNDAFSGCSGMTSVTIGNSVMNIGQYAFYQCSGLTSITIGSGVESIRNYAFASCKELTDVYCLAETVPSIQGQTFQVSYIEYATLHVPAASLEAYVTAEPWKNFGNIVSLTGKDIPDPQKCATPTIAFLDGKLNFSCETAGVEYVSEVTSKETKKYYSDKVAVGGTYMVSVYATKAGWDNSDVATLEFSVGSNGKVCDVNQDGAVDVADIATIIDTMAEKARGQEVIEE